MRFLVVGASGVLVNMAALVLLKEGLGLPLALASLLAIELSILSNFALNNRWTWGDRRSTSLSRRLIQYHTVAGFTGLTANWGLLVLLAGLFSVDYRLANLAGIAVGVALNFALNHWWTFSGRSNPPDLPVLRAAWRRLREELSPGWSALILVMLVATVGLRAVAMGTMPLIPEEAYYWMYSQHPDLSYFDHPPMVAWLIGLGTDLFGHTEFGVRWGGAALMLGASVLMFVFGRMWFGRPAAVGAAVLLQVLPVYFGTGLIATMDSALVFFWLAGLVGVSVALKEQRAVGWYLAGLGLGGAMLSKYTGVFLGAGALLAVLVHPPWRRHLRTVHPYLGGLLALGLFLPVLIWNAQHDWASFRFQFMDRFGDTALHPSKTAAYVLLQVAIFTPLLLVLLGWAAWRGASRPRRLLTPRWLIGWCFSLPLLLVMAHKSLRYDIHLNWTLPAYLSLFPATIRLGLALWRHRSATAGRLWQRAAATTVTLCLAINLLALGYVLVLQPRTGWISALGPWRPLAEEVERIENQLEARTGHEPLIVADGKYRLASILAFYRTPLEYTERASDQTTSQWILDGHGLGYPYWAPADRWRDRDYILVSEHSHLRQFASHFDRFEVVETFHPVGRKRYEISIAQGRHN
jgi:dolichol-phosphate mannosyltransferase